MYLIMLPDIVRAFVGVPAVALLRTPISDSSIVVDPRMRVVAAIAVQVRLRIDKMYLNASTTSALVAVAVPANTPLR